MKKIILLIIFLILLSFFGLTLANKYYVKPKNKDIVIENKTLEMVIEREESAEIKKKEELTKEYKIPEKALIQVPFLSQAPEQKWDALHEDACEEASLIMIKDFIRKKPAGTVSQQEKEIHDMVGFEDENKYEISVTLDQLNDIAKKYYGLDSGRVGKNITVEDIKKELSQGRPVIVGAAGKVLPNPNFKNGGPNYHMLVIKGYENGYFITNDPGTKKGENFKYTYNDLYKSIHDWDEKNILNGEKSYLVFD